MTLFLVRGKSFYTHYMISLMGETQSAGQWVKERNVMVFTWCLCDVDLKLRFINSVFLNDKYCFSPCYCIIYNGMRDEKTKKSH